MSCQENLPYPKASFNSSEIVFHHYVGIYYKAEAKGFFFQFFILWPYPQHMEVPGTESGCSCNNAGSFNPLDGPRDRTYTFTTTQAAEV